MPTPDISQSEQQSKDKRGVAMSSVLASGGLTALKLVVGIMSGSMGVLSEAAHSLLDLGAASLTFYAVKAGDKPADEDHHYGHGKIESVSALVETGLLFLTSAWIIYEAVQRLVFHNVEVETSWYTFAVIGVSIVIDISRSRALLKVAKETNSQALEADALHFSSDIWSSTVVLIGLGFVAFGMQWADSVASIGVSIFVAYAGYRLGKRTIDVLIDSAPAGLREKILEIARKVEGVLSIAQVRVRVIGADLFADMTVMVSRKLPLLRAHAIADRIVQNVRKEIPEADVVVHTKPLPVDSETMVERVHIAAADHNLQVHDVVVHRYGERKFLSYDLEVSDKISLQRAHEIATHLEETIRKELGGDIEIDTHIEPAHHEVVAEKKLPDALQEEVLAAIKEESKKFKQILDVHEIKIRGEREKVFVSMHCLCDSGTILEEVHEIATRFEHQLRVKLPIIERVIIHTEPASDGKTGCHQRV